MIFINNEEHFRCSGCGEILKKELLVQIGEHDNDPNVCFDCMRDGFVLEDQ